MTFPEIKDNSLYLNQKYYFEQLKSQLSKDLNNDDFDAQLKLVSFDKSELLPFLVQRFLEQVFDTNTNLFFQFMHRIDIPDVDMKTQISDSGIDFFGLTDLVLRRELIKILIREKYSK
jgi:hypothetical protein|tara:strand:+ start:82 stop:435 length:354 start_codon:yes stop_codon:yes gene_type:complete